MQLDEHRHQLALTGRSLLRLESIEAFISLPTDHLRHTCLAQNWMAEGEARGPRRR